MVTGGSQDDGAVGQGVARGSPALQHSPSSLLGSLKATFPTQFHPLPHMVKCSFLFWKGCFL